MLCLSVSDGHGVGQYCHSNLVPIMRKDFPSWANSPTHRSLKVIQNRVKSLLVFRRNTSKITLTTTSWTLCICKRHHKKSKNQHWTWKPSATVTHFTTIKQDPQVSQPISFSHLLLFKFSQTFSLQLSHNTKLFHFGNRELLLFLKSNKMKQILSDFQNHTGKDR